MLLLSRVEAFSEKSQRFRLAKCRRLTQFPALEVTGSSSAW